jgi:hypothetical protein
MHPDLANFFEYRFIVESFPVMIIEIFAGGYDDEQSIKLARPGSILRTQRAAARDPGVSLELPVSLLAVFPGDRQRGWANRPERRALPDSRARAQRVGTTTPGFRRHRFADIRETRNRFASSRSLGPGLDHLRGGQPHLLPAGPLRRVQTAAIGVPHASGIAHRAPDDQT